MLCPMHQARKLAVAQAGARSPKSQEPPLAPFLKIIRAGTRADILSLGSRSLFLYLYYNYRNNISSTVRPVASAICSMVITFMAFNLRAVSRLFSSAPSFSPAL